MKNKKIVTMVKKKTDRKQKANHPKIKIFPIEHFMEYVFDFSL